MVSHPSKRLPARTTKEDDADRDRADSRQQQDAQALLTSANGASERVAGQHMAFMAVCVYVLVIVFGTTDIDLLTGRGVKLPVINVDVPIVGFYAFAPFLVVLVHFNLLLQLQLLSRELFAFDAAAPQEEHFGGLRDRLHIFPYTYFLVGKLSTLMRRLIGLMVSITMLVLPFVTLLALQFWFLAYQSEPVTWLQRVAIWIDIVVVTILWPIILHPRDDWWSYWRDILTILVPQRRIWIAFVVLVLGHVLFSFSATAEQSRPLILTGTFVFGYALLLLSPPLLILLSGWQRIPTLRRLHFAGLFLVVIGLIIANFGMHTEVWTMIALFAVPWLFVPLAMFWHPQSPRGSLALLLTLYLGPLLPLTLQVDGERIEQILLSIQGVPQGSTMLSSYLTEQRRLDLTEQVLLAKPTSHETLMLVHSGEGEKALQQTEPLNLDDRKLRQAKLHKAILIGASLREADIQGAFMMAAHFQGARFYKASLQNAVFDTTDLQNVSLESADLQSAYLGNSRLHGADLRQAQLQGADLRGAHLLGANLAKACLQGALLSKAQLQGADLHDADLQGADLQEADLRGADLSGALLGGANLSKANLYGIKIDGRREQLVEIRDVAWVPFEKDGLQAMVADARRWIPDKETVELVVQRLNSGQQTRYDNRPFLTCLVDASDKVSVPGAPHTICEKLYDSRQPEEVDQFTQQLHPSLVSLACTSPHVAWGIIQQSLDKEKGLSRNGLAEVLRKQLDAKECRGMRELSADKKKQLPD